MRNIVFGLLAIGWLGCGVESSPPVPDREVAVSQSSSSADLALDGFAQPGFNACLAGQTCALIGGCNGQSNNVSCGVGRVCCTPSGPGGCDENGGICVDGTRCPGDLPNRGACSTTAVCCRPPD